MNFNNRLNRSLLQPILARFPSRLMPDSLIATVPIALKIKYIKILTRFFTFYRFFTVHQKKLPRFRFIHIFMEIFEFFANQCKTKLGKKSITFLTVFQNPYTKKLFFKKLSTLGLYFLDNFCGFNFKISRRIST
jgi:hypothetical protein